MLEVTAAQMKELERKASEGGLSYEDMMENAGQAAARILLEQLPAFAWRPWCAAGATTAATAL